MFGKHFSSSFTLCAHLKPSIVLDLNYLMVLTPTLLPVSLHCRSLHCRHPLRICMNKYNCTTHCFATDMVGFATNVLKVEGGGGGGSELTYFCMRKLICMCYRIKPPKISTTPAVYSPGGIPLGGRGGGTLAL